jgi:hypothetical protein
MGSATGSGLAKGDVDTPGGCPLDPFGEVLEDC